MVERTPEQHAAFISSLKNYKPWHTPKWNSTGNDAFPHIISGALKMGFLTAAAAQNQFDVSPERLAMWERGEYVPERKIRKKVWSYLRKEAGMAPSSQ